MKIKTTKFGSYQDQEVTLYTLTNLKGTEVKIMNYGATITSFKILQKNGALKEIVCGFDSFDGYLSEAYKLNSPYFGCTVGRYCSQIKDSKFVLNNRTYHLSSNAGDNNLHGGNIGFDKRIWQSEILSNDENSSSIKFTLNSVDLEEGFPGNLDVSVIFSLNNEDELSISYEGTPDKDTPLSLTNHSYFNLSGFVDSIENHKAQVYTTERLALDETGAATGEIIKVKDLPDDLSEGKIIKDVHEAMNDGFEHFYVFDNSNESLNKVATISDKFNGHQLEVYTTEPCMLLYTGKYTSDELKRESGDQFGKFRAFCCETHRYPNGPNIKNSPKSITKAGETFKSNTVFKINSI